MDWIFMISCELENDNISHDVTVVRFDLVDSNTDAVLTSTLNIYTIHRYKDSRRNFKVFETFSTIKR